MAKKYKVWAYIEEIDEEKNTYEDIGEPTCIAEEDSLEEAQRAVDTASC